MKKRLIALAAFVITSFLSVQTAWSQTTGQYTLQQCIDIALKNFGDVKNAELDVKSADAKVGEIRGAGLPQLTANASLTDNPELQRMFMQGSNAVAFMPGAPLEPNKVYAFPNFFQLRSSGDMNLGLNQLLFDGTYILGLKASKVYKDLASKSLVQTKIAVVENVTKSFYLVLINKEQLELINANVSRLDTLLNSTKAYRKEGFMEDI
ncbi:MAG: outer membrane protein, partial [Cytophagaceae bacterium]|nr:outer membrane protein [Cytophagaceae bacterium]